MQLRRRQQVDAHIFSALGVVIGLQNVQALGRCQKKVTALFEANGWNLTVNAEVLVNRL